MKIPLFFSILFFFGVFVPPARSKEYYPVFNWWNACRQLGGQCKNKCGDKEFGMSYCARPTTHCCLKECDPME
ncbi:beta-defensin 112 [Diceros bicornis minor]|uniref:beta-defensin 112 n=1 Tax=Diceros bicornis minor TaxID=77932 RepID=UPI0026E945C4|nr:beta-defensin 112 [Diceros bicornis minor]